tara:strand:- start:149 stop:634 length:486 start_codon:yes stop_codon:yes gene_type:complete
VHDDNLQDFSHVCKPRDTLGDLARQHAAVKSYSQGFAEPGSCYSYHDVKHDVPFGGRRLTFVSKKLSSLLLEYATIDCLLTRNWVYDTERVILFDWTYSAHTNSLAYRELLGEHKQLVANAESIFWAEMSLKDSLKKIESRMAYLRSLNFGRTLLVRIFGY